MRNSDKFLLIVVSASAMKGDRENFISMGFDGYVSKPIDNNFTQVIGSWMGKKVSLFNK